MLRFAAASVVGLHVEIARIIQLVASGRQALQAVVVEARSGRNCDVGALGGALCKRDAGLDEAAQLDAAAGRAGGPDECLKADSSRVAGVLHGVDEVVHSGLTKLTRVLGSELTKLIRLLDEHPSASLLLAFLSSFHVALRLRLCSLRVLSTFHVALWLRVAAHSGAGSDVVGDSVAVHNVPMPAQAGVGVAAISVLGGFFSCMRLPVRDRIGSAIGAGTIDLGTLFASLRMRLVVRLRSCVAVRAAIRVHGSLLAALRVGLDIHVRTCAAVGGCAFGGSRAGLCVRLPIGVRNSSAVRAAIRVRGSLLAVLRMRLLVDMRTCAARGACRFGGSRAALCVRLPIRVRNSSAVRGSLLAALRVRLVVNLRSCAAVSVRGGLLAALRLAIRARSRGPVSRSDVAVAMRLGRPRHACAGSWLRCGCFAGLRPSLAIHTRIGASGLGSFCASVCMRRLRCVRIRIGLRRLGGTALLAARRLRAAASLRARAALLIALAFGTGLPLGRGARLARLALLLAGGRLLV